MWGLGACSDLHGFDERCHIVSAVQQSLWVQLCEDARDQQESARVFRLQMYPSEMSCKFASPMGFMIDKNVGTQAS